MDVGVAKPSAHGQAITRTAINFSSASAKSPGCYPNIPNHKCNNGNSDNDWHKYT